GYEYVYLGEADECEMCSLRLPCHHNLERGRRYVVKSVRGKTHPCSLFGQVVVCDVDEMGVDAAIAPGFAFVGSSITFKSVDCKNPLCDYSGLCMPEGVSTGDRCTITGVKKKINCPEKRSLVVATLRRI
ncbi:MAG TPA: UPF0179 family protein, partial [Euryarchaeota archaeon]|nr:UPF0179 family protein [Euryarchaeota archaeon]